MMRITLVRLALILTLFTTSIASYPLSFPYEEFFGITSTDLADYSSYLCTINPDDPKCCECDAYFCFENCCIDAMWIDDPYSNLTEYLHNNSRRHQTDAYYGTCQPLLPSLNAGHQTEYLLLQSRVYEQTEQERAVDICPQRPFTLPVFSEVHDVLYESKECGIKNGAKNFTPLSIQVKCVEAYNISNGDFFTIKTQEEQLEKCIFLSDQDKNTIDLHIIVPCEVDIPDVCPKNTKYTDICGSYYAPIGQDKNRHCKECVEGSPPSYRIPEFPNSRSQEIPNSKCTCPNGQCTMPKPKYSNISTSFKLISSESYMIIDDIRYIFQPSKFLGEGSDIRKNIDYSLHLCSKGIKAKCCSCEPSCFIFKTCCMDILWDERKEMNMMAYKELLIEKAQQYPKEIKCEKLLPNIDEEKNEFYMMVTSCPMGASRAAKEKCGAINSSRLETYIPVLDEDKYLYRNRYCAHCNNVYLYNIVKIAVDCNFNQNNFDENCKFQIHQTHEKIPFSAENFHPNSDDIKPCGTHIKDIDSYCNKSNKYYQLCKAYKSNYGRYKNYHCYKCNSTGFHQHLMDNTCTRMRQLFRWSMIINFNADVEVSIINQENKEDIKVCQGKSLFFDLGAQEVRKSSCNEQQRETYEIASNVTTPGFDICNRKTKFYAFHFFHGNLMEDRKNSLFNVSINYREPYYKNDDIVVYRSIGTYTLASILQQNHTNRTGEKYLFHTVQNPVLSELHGLNFSNAFNDGICQNPIDLVPNTVNYTTSCEVLYDSREYTTRQTSSWISIKNNDLKKHITICRTFFDVPKCDLTQIRGGEIIDEKTRLYRVKHENNEKNFSIKEYYPLQFGIAICSTIFSRRRLLEIIVDIEGYITTIGTSISVVCYIAMLPLFLMLETFKNLSGRCCLALTFNLLVADSMVLLASTLHNLSLKNMKAVCEGVGVIVHFGLTMVYSWGVAIAYDVTFRISSMQLVSAHDMKRFKSYSLVTNLYSAIIVTFAYVFDKLNIVMIGYGENGICAPNKFYGRLYFYVIPAIIALVLSIGFIAFTLSKIKSIIKIRKTVLRSSRKEHMTTVIVAFKLILVLGLSEGIGFIQIKSSGEKDGAITFQAVCSLLYTSLRSLRGVFIFLVYICRLEVFNVWRQFVVRKLNRRKLDTGSSSVKDDAAVVGQNQLVVMPPLRGISDTRM